MQRKHNKRGKQHHGDAEAVDADEILNVVGGNPWSSFDKLQTGLSRVEVREQPARHQQRRNRKSGRDPADQVGLLLGSSSTTTMPATGIKVM